MLLSAPPAWHTPCHIITTCSRLIRIQFMSCQRNKIRILDRPAIQSNRNVKCEILEYAFIAMRGVDCVTLTTEGPRYGTLSLLRIWNTHYTPDDASGSVSTVCRPLIGHSVQTLPSHWLISWYCAVIGCYRSCDVNIVLWLVVRGHVICILCCDVYI